MAIGVNIRNEVTFILRSDSAIPQTDEGEKAYDRYFEDGFNEDHLAPVMNGGKPTRFTVRRLSYDARLHCDEIQSAPARSDFVVRAALKRVDNLEQVRDGNRVTVLRPPEFEDVEPYGPMVTLDWIREANLPSEIINAIAGTARVLSEGKVPFAGESNTRSSPSESEGKSGPAQSEQS